MIYFFLLLFAAITPEDVVTSRVDLLEHNTLYDDNGKITFHQFVFYNYRWDGEKECVGWDLINHDPITNEFKHVVGYKLRIDFLFNKKYVMFERTDGQRYLLKVYYSIYQRSHTQYDPEQLNREIIEKEQRLGFPKPFLPRD